MRLRVFLTIFMVCLVVYSAKGQETAIVKNFTQTIDHIPGNDRRSDLNGTLCALVKVQVIDEIERVEGNKIGDIVERGVEKWVYMCAGSRNMRIHLKNHLPVRVRFADFQIDELESNRVYELVIEIPDADQKGQEKKRTLKWNLRLGYSFDNMTGGHDLSGTSGFEASFGVSKPIGNKKWFWGVEAGAMSYSARIDDETASCIGATVNPRIGIKMPFAKEIALSIYGGPYLGFRFGEDEKSKYIYNRSGYSTDEKGYEHQWQQSKYQSLNIKDDEMDFGVNLGVELFVSKAFFFDIHIKKGFTSSGKSVVSTYESDGYGYQDDKRDEKDISSLKVVLGIGFQF